MSFISIDWSHDEKTKKPKIRCAISESKIIKKVPDISTFDTVVTENMPRKQMKEFSEQGIHVFCTSTNQTAKYRKLMGVEKTDENDAMILYLLYKHSPQDFYEYHYEPKFYELQTLVSIRERIMFDRVAIGNQLWATDSEIVGKHYVDLEKQEHAIDKDIEKLLLQFPIYTQFITHHDGIASKTAARLIAYYGDPNRFANEACMNAYFGLHVLPDGEAPRRKKGSLANWHQNGRALILGIISDCIIKLNGTKEGSKNKRVLSPYRILYDRFKIEESKRIWTKETRNTLVQGELVPAWLAHKRAVRKMMKFFMSRLFRAYSRLQHGESVDDLILTLEDVQ